MVSDGRRTTVYNKILTMVLASTLLLGGCSSTEDCRHRNQCAHQLVVRTTAEQARIFGRPVSPELVAQELLRQLELHRTGQCSCVADCHRDHSLQPVDIVYYSAMPNPGDHILLRPLTPCCCLPSIDIRAPGPPDMKSFDTRGFYFEERILLPAGSYRGEVCNNGTRFRFSDPTVISTTPQPRWVRTLSGASVAVPTSASSIVLVPPGFSVTPSR